MKQLEIHMRKISELIPADYNPRSITSKEKREIKESIEKYGMVDPIIVNQHPERKDIIVGGHQRLKVLKSMKQKEAPCVYVYLENIQDEKELNIRLNKNKGHWDYISLGKFFEVEDLLDWGFQETDFPDQWFNDTPSEDEEPEEFEPPKIEEVKTKLKKGDVICIGDHRLMCGDSTSKEDMTTLMNGELAEMVFTDPPWNVNYGAVEKGNAQEYKPRTIMNDHMDTEDFKSFMDETFARMKENCKPGTPVYIVMSAQEWGNLMLSLHQADFHWSSTIIWAKDRIVLSRKDYHTQYEPIWYGWINGAPRLKAVRDRKQSDLWQIERPSKSELHPTTKPIELIDKALINSSKRRTLVLEQFGGSGSTMVSCEKNARICYTMELDPKYCQVIAERMHKAYPNLPITKNGKKWSL